jgi:hypothetical protein
MAKTKAQLAKEAAAAKAKAAAAAKAKEEAKAKEIYLASIKANRIANSPYATPADIAAAQAAHDAYAASLRKAYEKSGASAATTKNTSGASATTTKKKEVTTKKTAHKNKPASVTHPPSQSVLSTPNQATEQKLEAAAKRLEAFANSYPTSPAAQAFQQVNAQTKRNIDDLSSPTSVLRQGLDAPLNLQNDLNANLLPELDTYKQDMEGLANRAELVSPAYEQQIQRFINQYYPEPNEEELIKNYNNLVQKSIQQDIASRPSADHFGAVYDDKTKESMKMAMSQQIADRLLKEKIERDKIRQDAFIKMLGQHPIAIEQARAARMASIDPKIKIADTRVQNAHAMAKAGATHGELGYHNANIMAHNAAAQANAAATAAGLPAHYMPALANQLPQMTTTMNTTIPGRGDSKLVDLATTMAPIVTAMAGQETGNPLKAFLPANQQNQNNSKDNDKKADQTVPIKKAAGGYVPNTQLNQQVNASPQEVLRENETYRQGVAGQNFNPFLAVAGDLLATAGMPAKDAAQLTTARVHERFENQRKHMLEEKKLAADIQKSRLENKIKFADNEGTLKHAYANTDMLDRYHKATVGHSYYQTNLQNKFNYAQLAETKSSNQRTHEYHAAVLEETKRFNNLKNQLGYDELDERRENNTLTRQFNQATLEEKRRANDMLQKQVDAKLKFDYDKLATEDRQKVDELTFNKEKHSEKHGLEINKHEEQKKYNQAYLATLDKKNTGKDYIHYRGQAYKINRDADGNPISKTPLPTRIDLSKNRALMNNAEAPQAFLGNPDSQSSTSALLKLASTPANANTSNFGERNEKNMPQENREEIPLEEMNGWLPGEVVDPTAMANINKDIQQVQNVARVTPKLYQALFQNLKIARETPDMASAGNRFVNFWGDAGKIWNEKFDPNQAAANDLARKNNASAVSLLGTTLGSNNTGEARAKYAEGWPDPTSMNKKAFDDASYNKAMELAVNQYHSYLVNQGRLYQRFPTPYDTQNYIREHPQKFLKFVAKSIAPHASKEDFKGVLDYVAHHFLGEENAGSLGDSNIQNGREARQQVNQNADPYAGLDPERRKKLQEIDAELAEIQANKDK